MVTKDAASITSQKPFQTSFFNVIMPNSYGALYTKCLGYHPHSIDDLFVNWSKAGGNIHNLLLLTAASALCWTIWITRNEVVFDKCREKTFLQVLFRETH
jgi:hypothetical protein